MKIIFNRQEICNAISPLMCAVSGKNTLTAADGILIEASLPNLCVLTAFDLEKGIRMTINVNVIEEGSYIINAQKFNQTIKVMDGEDIILSVDSKMCATFECGRSSHKTGSLPASDFPEVPRLTSEKGFKINQSVLKKMLSKTEYAMGVNDTRPVLNGCFIRTEGDMLHLVACDTFKLAVCSCKTKFESLDEGDEKTDFSFILPVKSVNELIKLLSDNEEKNATVYMSHKNIVIDLGNIIFFSRLILGEYLNYERVIIRNHKIFVEADKQRFMSALERAALITEERIVGSIKSRVKLDVVGNLLEVSAVSSSGSIYDEFEIDHEGENISISFNNRFLIDSIRNCSSDKIKISLSSKFTSVNIEPVQSDENISELFMVFPVRTKD